MSSPLNPTVISVSPPATLRANGRGLAIALLGLLAGRVEAVAIAEAEYEGRPHFVIRTERVTWFYDRAGGGFSRLIDADRRDWIAFRKQPLSQFPASAAAGYRGIPNAVFRGPDQGAGHPGFDQCTSERFGEAAIRTRSRSGKWAWRWDFTESSASLTMERADPDFPWWFLYEGPVAGSFAPQDKYWGTDRGGPRDERFDRHAPPQETWQWVYCGDRRVPRILFIVQHAPDTLPDTLWFLGAAADGAIDAPDGMVVLGLGRSAETVPQLKGTGPRFTVGLLELKVVTTEDHARVAQAIAKILASSP